ncbi:RNA polymerase sigma-70 factor [Flavicella sp.]|uniref:RNA polymerase sigma-70 factor n=1 Tax=Flavicella sp. TaxID=2957742 RepID=UPI0030181B9D
MANTILGRIKLGDDKAFELLYRKYFARLCAFANKFLCDPNLSEEMVQEVFLKIWKNRASLKDQTTEKSYLFQAIQNTSINELHKIKNRNAYQEVLKVAYSKRTEFNVHDSLLGKELDEKINNIISNLPTKCRKIFLLSRKEGKKYREIAEELNISIKTIETQMSRAFKKLKLELHEYITVILISLFINN